MNQRLMPGVKPGQFVVGPGVGEDTVQEFLRRCATSERVGELAGGGLLLTIRNFDRYTEEAGVRPQSITINPLNSQWGILIASYDGLAMHTADEVPEGVCIAKCGLRK